MSASGIITTLRGIGFLHGISEEYLQQLAAVSEEVTFPEAKVIMVSGKGEIEDAVAAMKDGAFDYISKPVERDELVARVHQACWAAKLVRDLHEYPGPVARHSVGTRSASMLEIQQNLETLLDDRVASLTRDVDDGSDSTRVVFPARVVEARGFFRHFTASRFFC